MRLSITLAAFIIASAYNPVPVGVVWIACTGMMMCVFLDVTEMQNKRKNKPFDEDKWSEKKGIDL